MTDSDDIPSSPTGGSSRVLLPVPGLNVACAWQVGPVRFLPAGAARELVHAMARPDAGCEDPAFQSYLEDRMSVLDRFAVAEVASAEGNEDALAMVSDALAVLRAVQHMRNPMVGMGHQSFGLPGEVPSAVVDYVITGDGLTVGAARRGALAGWEFTAEDHRAWENEPAFRFLDQAFATPEPDRTVLQARALLAVRLLSQGWLSYQPDLEVLNSAIALETLLGEATDQDKKFRIAPLRRVLADMRAGRVMRCSQFLDVCALYDARNEIVHGGQLPADKDPPRTWFIGAQLLSKVLAWFAAHPDSELSDLDAEISALPTPAAAS